MYRRFSSRGDTGAMLGIWVLLFSRKSRIWRNFQHYSAGFRRSHCCVGALVSPVRQFRSPDGRDVHIPSHCLGPQSAEGTGLGLCDLWEKKDLPSIIAELMASHQSNLLLPNCNNLALPPCSPRSPCLPHTCAHSCLSCPKAPVRTFSTLPLAWWEAACASPGSQIWGAEGHMGQQQLSPAICILTASVVPRTHRHLKSCGVTGGRQTERHTLYFFHSVHPLRLHFLEVLLVWN